MRKIAFFVLAFLLVVSSIFASDKTYGNVVVSRIISVYDGDTFKVDIDEWPDIIGSAISVRIYGIDTPELKDKRPQIKKLARKARTVTKYYLTHARRVELRNIRRGKYFRIVAEVYVDGKNLAQILIEQGLAKPYYGGKKEKW